MKKLFGYMARDESRHAGFINQWLKDFNIGVDLSFLTKAKKYTFLNRNLYFTLHTFQKRLVMRDIFQYTGKLRDTPNSGFTQFFFGLKNGAMMNSGMVRLLHYSCVRSNFIKRGNLLWIKFFLLAVFATMFVQRP